MMTFWTFGNLTSAQTNSSSSHTEHLSLNFAKRRIKTASVWKEKHPQTHTRLFSFFAFFSLFCSERFCDVCNVCWVCIIFLHLACVCSPASSRSPKQSRAPWMTKSAKNEAPFVAAEESGMECEKVVATERLNNENIFKCVLPLRTRDWNRWSLLKPLKQFHRPDGVEKARRGDSNRCWEIKKHVEAAPVEPINGGNNSRIPI